jgi:hypothetical protein
MQQAIAVCLAAQYEQQAERIELLCVGSACAGTCLPLCHASLRSPNLKARLASAREEFRAVW